MTLLSAIILSRLTATGGTVHQAQPIFLISNYQRLDSLRMKKFSAMPLVEHDPELALHIEDELPACVDRSDYEGPRGMAEVLALTTRASDILELADIANKLNLGRVRVLRVGAGASNRSVFAPYDHPCLEECGAVIFAISDFDGLADGEVEGICHRFIWMTMILEVQHEPRWHQLAYYKAAVRQAGTRFMMPPSLVTNVSVAMLGQWWQLPVPAKAGQVGTFADRILEHINSWELAAPVIKDAARWVRDYQAPNENFDQMLSDFDRDRPLAGWKNAT